MADYWSIETLGQEGYRADWSVKTLRQVGYTIEHQSVEVLG